MLLKRLTACGASCWALMFKRVGADGEGAMLEGRVNKKLVVEERAGEKDEAVGIRAIMSPRAEVVFIA